MACLDSTNSHSQPVSLTSGGHCGKADDHHHHHLAPLHLQTTVGHAKPIAYALDGYALYGSLEPDGSALLPLDDYNGHTDSTGKYHFHGTTTYPNINGGLKGKVTVSQGGIEPQPVTKPMRAPGDPFRGAVITMFETIAAGTTGSPTRSMGTPTASPTRKRKKP